jgi:hypothetical protein
VRRKRIIEAPYLIAEESEGMYRLIRPNHEAQGNSREIHEGDVVVRADICDFLKSGLGISERLGAST